MYGVHGMHRQYSLYGAYRAKEEGNLADKGRRSSHPELRGYGPGWGADTTLARRGQWRMPD